MTGFFPPLIVLTSSFPPFLYTSNFLGSASKLPLHTHLRVLPLQSKRDDQIMKPSGLWYAAVNSGLLKALHRGIACLAGRNGFTYQSNFTLCIFFLRLVECYTLANLSNILSMGIEHEQLFSKGIYSFIEPLHGTHANLQMKYLTSDVFGDVSANNFLLLKWSYFP